MSLILYTISNTSATSKTFSYSVETSPQTITVNGFSQVDIIADDSPAPALIPVGVSEEEFLSSTYIPSNGEALLWNDGNKVKHIKISNTPLTGSSIDSIIGKTQWLEFAMVGAKNSSGNFLYPNSPTVSQTERYNIIGANNQNTYSILGINQKNSSTAVDADTSSAETGFSFFDKQFLIPTNCNPLDSNVSEPRFNEWLQDVDYSVNAITPLNFEQLINFEAIRATVPQSNYTQLGFSNSRYIGSSTTRENINEYNPNSNIDLINTFLYSDGITDPFLSSKGKGAPLGKIPNVELNNAYIAYFNKIIDPYPLLNNKTAYYIKYLIDDQGNILDPGLSNINYSVFTETFKLRDYDEEPTRINVSIQNIDEAKELTKLTTGLSSTFEIGKYPVPILYTQTSSVGYTNELYLSGSKFYTVDGAGLESGDFLNYGVNIFATQSVVSPSAQSPSNLNLEELEFNSSDITPLAETNIIIPTSSLEVNNNKYIIYFPPSSIEDRGKPISENYPYRIEGNLKFTTSTMPARYKGKRRTSGRLDFFVERNEIQSGSTRPFKVIIQQFKKPPLTSEVQIGNYSLDTVNISIPENGGVTLKITQYPGEANEVSYILKLNRTTREYGNQWNYTGNGIVFEPNSLYIEDLIITNILNGNVLDKKNRREAASLIGGGWARDNSDLLMGIGGIPVKYDWEINFELNNFFQGSAVYIRANSTLINQPNNAGRPNDVFTFYGGGGNALNNLQWQRTFNPVYSTGVDTKPSITYKVISALAASSNDQNRALGPFWRRYPLTLDKLYMSSSILNQTYDSTWVQAKLPYNSGPNTDFPLTIEPEFIDFDPVVDFWSLQKGDEIRFENNEDLVYTIISDPEPPKNAFSEFIGDKLQITVFPSFEVNPPTNFDFFVVRRWKENKNFIILDQQKPYGFPVSQSSSPGILLPEYRVDKFNVNPDLVLKDLIEKSII